MTEIPRIFFRCIVLCCILVFGCQQPENSDNKDNTKQPSTVQQSGADGLNKEIISVQATENQQNSGDLELKMHSFDLSRDFKFTESLCHFTKENAIKDVESDSLMLAVGIGFTGLTDSNKSRIERFQKDYLVEFQYIGCVRMCDPSEEDLSAYNKVVLDHLVERYGEVVMIDYNWIWEKDEAKIEHSIY
ncbi:MAG: hypothetical protein HRT74_12755 [Flavobacteriales bacterium]|nr:hypothetical protein [Flavobacteriales bacterium]